MHHNSFGLGPFQSHSAIRPSQSNKNLYVATAMSQFGHKTVQWINKVRIFLKSRASSWEWKSRLTKNLILRNIFVKCEVLAHFHSIILACFHQPQEILKCSLQWAQQGTVCQQMMLTVLPRSEPRKVSSKQCGRFNNRVKENESPRTRVYNYLALEPEGKDQCISETRNNYLNETGIILLSRKS